MHPPDLHDVARQLIDHAQGGTTATDDRGPYRVPSSTYTDPELFELERTRIFSRAPQLICLSAEIESPGDYIAFDALPVPILVLRDERGRARAFLNSCRHRGARVASGRGSGAKGFTCPYHAWRFGLSGELVAVNAAETFGPVAGEELGLIELPCREAAGLVFASPSQGSPFTLEESLGDLLPELAGYGLERAELIRSGEFQVDANWKLSLDSFSEGYHFSSLHRDTLGQMTLSNVMTYDRFGPGGHHHRLGYPSKSILELNREPESEWAPERHLGFVYFVYPNVSMLVAADTVEVFRVYPAEEVGRQKTLYHLYHRTSVATPEERRLAEEQFDYIYRVVETEDFAITAQEQRAIESGQLPYLNFGRNEPALIGLHESLRQAVGLELAGKFSGPNPTAQDASRSPIGR